MEPAEINRQGRPGVLAPAAASACALPRHAAATGERARSQATSASPAAPAVASYRRIRVGEASGIRVRDEGGESVGRLGDMIVDMNTGHAATPEKHGIFQHAAPVDRGVRQIAEAADALGRQVARSPGVLGRRSRPAPDGSGKSHGIHVALHGGGEPA